MRDRLGQLAVVVIFFGVWEALIQTGLVARRYLVPPSEVLITLSRLVGERDVQEGLVTTAVEIFTAAVIAVPAGIIVGLLVAELAGASSTAARALYLGTAVPKSVFLPLFILALGVGFVQKVSFGVVQAFFVIAVSTIAAVQAIPQGLLLVGRGLDASRAQMYWHVYLPYTLPVVVQGVRIGIIFAAIGILFAEMYVSHAGLGRLINLWGSAYQLPELLAGVLLAASGTIVLNELIRTYERRVGRWRG